MIEDFLKFIAAFLAITAVGYFVDAGLSSISSSLWIDIIKFILPGPLDSVLNFLKNSIYSVTSFLLIGDS